MKLKLYQNTIQHMPILLYYVIQRWMATEAIVKQAANESKDNNQFLVTLKPYYDPLYSNNPVSYIGY